MFALFFFFFVNIVDTVISLTLSPENLPGSALTDQELGERFESLTGRKATSMQNSNVITCTLTRSFIKGLSTGQIDRL